MDKSRYSIVSVNKVDRTSVLSIVVPALVLIEYHAALKHAGHIESVSIPDELQVWFPESNFADYDKVCQYIQSVLKSFALAKPEDREDLILSLPLGTYVEAKYKVDVDKLINVLLDLQSFSGKTGTRFQWMLSEALRDLILSIDNETI